MSIAQRILTTDEMVAVQGITNNNDNVFNIIRSIDIKIGGAGIHNINNGNMGRYDIKDRDIFRPIQYIYAYLKMNPEDFQWVTRGIIHMSGLHLESLIKKLLSLSKIPLGQALALPLAKLALDNQLYSDLKIVIKPYNNAKHQLKHHKDTHLFNVESALLYYVAVRKISLKLMTMTHLHTRTETWNSLGSELPD